MEVAGLQVFWWVDMSMTVHWQTDQGFAFAAWPDGGATLEQEEVALAAFRIVRDEREKIRAEELRKHANKKRR